MSKLDERPTVGALTVPFMVDEARNPIDFKAVDEDHVALCAKHQKCGVCGGKIRRGPFAFIGPDDGRTCFADPWMHPECAAVAFTQCPFLAGRRDWREVGARRDALLRSYSVGMVAKVAANGRAHREGNAWHFQPIGALQPLPTPEAPR